MISHIARSRLTAEFASTASTTAGTTSSNQSVHSGGAAASAAAAGGALFPLAAGFGAGWRWTVIDVRSGANDWRDRGRPAGAPRVFDWSGPASFGLWLLSGRTSCVWLTG